MKMSVVGCEASGKTVFLSALADYYKGGDRPCLVPENEAANNFQRFQLRQMRNLHQWPSATDPGKTLELKWTLRRDGQTLSEIDLLEFGGETFREAFRGEKASGSHQEAVNALTQHLGGSEFVVILVSLKDLLRDQAGLSAEEFERDTEALWVTRGLLRFLEEQTPQAKIVIGLTQADRFRGEIAAAGSAEKLLEQRWPSIAAVAHGHPIVPVASVSATDENGNPAPDYTTDGILPVMEEFETAQKKTASRKPASAPSSSRRPLLLLLLLAACVALWSQFRDEPVPPPTVERIVQTNVVETTVTKTNVVERAVTKTNIVERAVVKTNFIEQVVAPAPPAFPTFGTQPPEPPPASQAAPTPPPALRTWHDHNGTPIDAKWVETTDDGQRIILEMTDGKRIRAAVRKFCDEDRKYIAEQLKAKEVGSAGPAL